MKIKLDRDLEEIDLILEKMFNLTVGSFKNFIDMLTQGSKDTSLAEELEEQIDDIENIIDARCIDVIVLYSPKALDLRKIITLMKISNEMERMADYAYKLSFSVARGDICLKDDVILKIVELTNMVLDMFESVMKARGEKNVKLAAEVYMRDNEVNLLYREILGDFFDYNLAKEKIISSIISVKRLERAGDRIKNITENIIYLLEGKKIDF